MSLLRSILSVTRAVSVQPMLTKVNCFHVLARATQILPSFQNILVPKIPSIVPVCGLKVKGRVKRRCKDCYMVWRENRLYNMCKTHPRHKQMSMVKDEKNTWILSHATQGKIRPW